MAKNWSKIFSKLFYTFSIPIIKSLIFGKERPVWRGLVKRKPIEIVNLIPVVYVQWKARFHKIQVGVVVAELVWGEPNAMTVLNNALWRDM